MVKLKSKKLLTFNPYWDIISIKNEIEKINEVKLYDDDMLICPTENKCSLRADEEGEMLNPKEVLKNAPRHNGNYISVPVVIGEKGGMSA